MLRRGWSPSERQRIACYLGLGLVLVLNPFLVQWFGLGGPTYEYRAVEVTPAGDRIAFETDVHPQFRHQPVSGVDCFERWGSYTCALSESLAERGSATVGTTRYESRPRARYVSLEDGFYRRNVTESANGTTLSLERVPAATVLDDVSHSRESVSPPVESAIEDGSIRSHREMEKARFVETDAGYYYVGARRIDGGLRDRWWFSLGGVLLGLAALRRGEGLRTGWHE